MFLETAILKSIICDHMGSNQLKPHTIEINNPMTLAFKSASSKCKINSGDNQKQKQETEIEKKIFQLTVVIDRIEIKYMELEKAAKMMDDKIMECMKFAEEKRDLSYVFKGNMMKRNSDKTKESVGVLKKEVT